MISAHDVAAHLLKLLGETHTLKLQKLVYYTQAWHVALTGERLFEDEIQAWRKGPVCRALWDVHHGEAKVTDWPQGDPSRVGPIAQLVIAGVLATYGSVSGIELGKRTHREPPWREARPGLSDFANCENEITPKMMTYYGVSPEAKQGPMADVARRLRSLFEGRMQLGAAVTALQSGARHFDPELVALAQRTGSPPQDTEEWVQQMLRDFADVND
jgi:uncharacterized phage-associated protein